MYDTTYQGETRQVPEKPESPPAAPATPDEAIVRVVARLRGGVVQDGAPMSMADFPTRQAYRKALAKARRHRLAPEIEKAQKALEAIEGVHVTCQATTRTVVLEGPARSIRKALELPFIESTLEDRELSLLARDTD